MRADFIDANVPIYPFEETDPREQAGAEQVVQGALPAARARSASRRSRRS